VNELPLEAFNMLEFLEHFTRFGRLPRKMVVENIPDFIFDQFHAININAIK
jgi:hypothetical protein